MRFLFFYNRIEDRQFSRNKKNKRGSSPIRKGIDMKKWIRFAGIGLMLLMGPCVLSAFAASGPDTRTTHSLLPEDTRAIIIPGKDLPKMLGKKIEGFRLFSYQKDTLVPIPFQIDQKDSDDRWIWDRTFQGGRTHDADDPEGERLLDGNDLLVFLTRDIGNRDPSVRRHGMDRRTEEIQVMGSTGETAGWAYLVYYESSPPALSSVRYMRYLPDERKIVSPVYEIRYSPKHIALLQDLRLNGRPILDRLKIRGKARLKLGFLKTTMHFNEEDIGGYLEGVIDGPVRTVLRTVNYVRLPLGLRTPRINCDHFYYPHHSEVPLVLSIRFLVDRASLLLTADYQGYPFRRVFLDGITNPVPVGPEGASSGHGATERKGNWIALDGDYGTVIHLLKLPEEVRQHATISLYLLDNAGAGNTPEEYPGSEPEAGFTIRTNPGFPRGDSLLYLIFFMSENSYHPGLERKVLKLLEDQPAYRVLE